MWNLLSAKGSRYLPFSSLHRVYPWAKKSKAFYIQSNGLGVWHATNTLGSKLASSFATWLWNHHKNCKCLLGPHIVNKSLNLNLHYRNCQVSKIEVLLLTYEAVYTCLYIGPMQGDPKQNYTSAYLFVGFSQDLLSSPEKPSFLTQYQEGDCVGREIGETKLSTSKSFDRMTARNQI